MRLSDMRAMRFVLGFVGAMLSAVPVAVQAQAAPTTPPTSVATPATPATPAAPAPAPATPATPSNAPASAPAPKAATPAPAPAVPAPAAPTPAAAAPAVPAASPSAEAQPAVPAAGSAAPSPATAPAAGAVEPTAPTEAQPTAAAPATPTVKEAPPRITYTPPAANEQGAGHEAAEEIEPADERARDLYLRLGLGMGFPFGSDVADEYQNRNQAELSFSGLGVALDWMGGIAVMPSLALGLGATTDTFTSGTVTNDAKEERKLEHSLYFAVIGGFVDFYFMPPAGFHMQALLGLSHISRADDLGRNTGNGFGIVLGAGYDLAVGQRWNVGVLARVAVSSFSMDAIGNEKLSPVLYEPTLVWTATFRPES